MKKHISVDEGLGLIYGNPQTRLALTEQIQARQVEAVVERTESFLKTKKILDERLRIARMATHDVRIAAAEETFWELIQ